MLKERYKQLLMYTGWLTLLAGVVLAVLIPTHPATAWVYTAGVVLCCMHDMLCYKFLQFLMGVIALCCGSYLLFEQPTRPSWAIFTLIYVLIAFYYTFRQKKEKNVKN